MIQSTVNYDRSPSNAPLANVTVTGPADEYQYASIHAHNALARKDHTNVLPTDRLRDRVEGNRFDVEFVFYL